MLGENIKRYRTEKNMTQAELGEKVGISNVAIMRYEKGQREPRREIMKKIADALGVEEYHLHGWDDLDEVYNKKGSLANEVRLYEDIGELIKMIINQLEQENRKVLYEGKELDEDTKELLKNSLQSNYDLIIKLTK